MDHLIAALHGTAFNLDAEEIAEVLWLAIHLPPSQESTDTPPSDNNKTEDASTYPHTSREQDLPTSPIQTTSQYTSMQSAPQKITAARHPPTQTTVHRPESADSARAVVGVGAIEFYGKSAPALPGALDLARALRPLKHSALSPIRRMLDEEATVRLIADSHIWMPVLRPMLERFHDVALVVDASPSMTIWQQTVDEFLRLLENHGAFRNVTTWSLAPLRAGAGELALFPGIGPHPHWRDAHMLQEIIDPIGRRLILLLSDTVDDAWYRSTMADALALWGTHNLTTLVQMLPAGLWQQTALAGYRQVSLFCPSLPMNNRFSHVEHTIFDLLDEEEPTDMPIPVVTLDDYALAQWAEFVTGKQGVRQPGLIWPGSPLPLVETYSTNTTDPITAEKQVDTFMATASPLAQQLAGYLATVPLTLPIMRLVQQHPILVHTRHTQLAEVFLSGLLYRQTPADAAIHPDEVCYDFHPGVREHLREIIRISDGIAVMSHISDYFVRRSGTNLNLRALLADPTSVDTLPIIDTKDPFTNITLKTLHDFGGKYRDLAKRLSERLETQKEASQVRTLDRKVSNNNIVAGQNNTPTFTHNFSIPPQLLSNYELRNDITGRDWVFDAIDRWLTDADGPRFFIITGEPGIGKSAIAACLTQMPERFPIAAVHFCMAQRAETLDPNVFVRSVFRQLAMNVPGFAAAFVAQAGIKGTLSIGGESHGSAVAVHIEQFIVHTGDGMAVGAFAQQVIAPLTEAVKAGAPCPVLLVDSLDNAYQRKGETIADLLHELAGAPVRVIMTLRPGEASRRFEGIPYLTIDANGEDNMRDAAAFIAARAENDVALAERLKVAGLTPNSLAKAAKGKFLYLSWLLHDLEQGGKIDLKRLPEGLPGFYREILRGREAGRDKQMWRSRYRQVMGVLAAAREPLPMEDLVRFCAIDKQQTNDIIVDLCEFLQPVQAQMGRFMLYHHSVSEFLGNREEAGEFWIDLAIANLAFIHTWDDNPDSWNSYTWRWAPWHLHEAGKTEELRRLLLNYNWLCGKLRALDINALIEDYDLLPDNPAMRLLQSALRLSAHILGDGQGKVQLPGQLLGRLPDTGDPAITFLLHRITLEETSPYIHPLHTTMTLAGGPLVRTLIGHSGAVWAIALTTDGCRALSGSDDRTLKVWDAENGACLHTLEGHTEQITAVMFTPDGSRALSGSSDRTLKLWDAERGACLRTLVGHTERVTAVALTTDGRRALSGSADRTLKVWDVESGICLRTLEGHADRVTLSRSPQMAAGRSPGHGTKR